MYSFVCFILLQVASYFSSYPREIDETFEFCQRNETTIVSLIQTLSKEEAFIAMCIVAPEIGFSSTFINESEIYAMKVLYVQGKLADFSIGPFQMKPSFAEKIEKYVANQPSLSHYSGLIISCENERETRYERVSRLSSLKWQLLYLSAFIEIVRDKTKDVYFKNPIERLKYWATLYNSNIELSPDGVAHQLVKKQFPLMGRKQYNYANVCAEFYLNEKFCVYLKQ